MGELIPRRILGIPTILSHRENLATETPRAGRAEVLMALRCSYGIVPYDSILHRPSGDARYPHLVSSPCCKRVYSNPVGRSP